MDTADLFAQLEVLDFPVDFTVDMEVVPAKRALEQVQRKKKDLLDQAEQYGAQPTGMPHSLPSAAGDLGEEDARLSATSVEVEVQSVTVLTVWADDPVTCDARARALVALLAGGNYRLVRPHGMQQTLFALGLPGAGARDRCGSSPSISCRRTGRRRGRSPRCGSVMRPGRWWGSIWTAGRSGRS
ncbi:hypothetical protein LUR56_05575 [Streptomyces sp. MT29]|nr:hypothetical protein [Streptomyces sp. MT29]